MNADPWVAEQAVLHPDEPARWGILGGTNHPLVELAVRRLRRPGGVA